MQALKQWLLTLDMPYSHLLTLDRAMGGGAGGGGECTLVSLAYVKAALPPIFNIGSSPQRYQQCLCSWSSHGELHLLSLWLPVSFNSIYAHHCLEIKIVVRPASRSYYSECE